MPVSDPRAVTTERVEAYATRVKTHAAKRDLERRASLVLSRWRLATFLPALALLAVAVDRGLPWAFVAASTLFFVFGVLVVRHARVDERAAWYEALRVVNERAIARIHRDWDQLPVGASDTANHPYADDLDIFGRASLYQWLGPAATEAGASTLTRWLLAPAPPGEIRLRQQAVDELAPCVEWREQLAAYGAVNTESTPLPIGAFLTWCESRVPPLPYYRAIRIAVYVLTASLWILIALHAAGATPAFWPLPLLAGLILSFVTAYGIHLAFNAAGAGQRALKQYAALLAHVVSPAFETPKLAALQAHLGSHTLPAPLAMRRLNRILGFAELRHGSALLHFPIQAITLWDFHVLFALEDWRRSVGPHVRDWLEATGEIDAVACLACARHDNPAWCQPQLGDERVFRAKALGHPLISDDRRVANDVIVGPPGGVLLITGSNMSGKSTLLRAIGLNAVLAQAGAPVCATHLQMPPADLHTSIRIQDSLERGISYFMAALARLKSVIDAAEREPDDRVLLYLLDEILQGTNSVERGMAVQAVARHLLAAPAIGAMTTHDLGVAEEEPLRSNARLVHFTETVDEGGQMTFDYTLRPGLATSRNAMRLMKLIGID
jgi:MutS-like protein